MSTHQEKWVPIATYAGGIEADVVVARLEAAGILAVRRDNDRAGIFGPGFQGTSAQGVTVLVPSDALLAAQEELADESSA